MLSPVIYRRPTARMIYTSMGIHSSSSFILWIFYSVRHKEFIGSIKCLRKKISEAKILSACTVFTKLEFGSTRLFFVPFETPYM